MAVLSIPVVKGKGFVEVDAETIPVEMYLEALRRGLKDMINSGTSKLGPAKGLEGEALAKYHAAAMAKANEKLAEINAGTFKVAGAKSATTGTSRDVMTEARRLARNAVKDELKKAKLKISHYEAKEITAAANELIAADPSFITLAEMNLKARAAAPAKIDIASLVKTSPKLVARAEERKKAKADGPISAKQAGMVTKRAKATQPTAH